MKKFRKGFTLVELLVIVAILGTLAAIMTLSSGTSIAKAKATTIVNNLKTCTAAAQVYYIENGDDSNATTGIESKTASDVVANVPNWSDFSGDDELIKYVPVAAGTGPENWAITVTITGSDAKDIAEALAKIKGFSSVKYEDGEDKKNAVFTYKLFKGIVEASS